MVEEENIWWEKKFIYPTRDDAIVSQRTFGRVVGEIDTVSGVSYHFGNSMSDRTTSCCDYRNVCSITCEGGETAELCLQTCATQDHPDCRDMTVSLSFYNQEVVEGEREEEARQRQIRAILSQVTMVARCLGGIPIKDVWIRRYGRRSVFCRKDV
jgi:hypothetical protein